MNQFKPIAQKAKIDTKTLESLEEKERFQLCETGFKFLDDHKGFRKGYTHGLLAYPGVGKTSITRALLKKLLTKHKVLYYSSEETKEQIEMKLLDNQFNVDDVENNLFIVHEKDIIQDFVNITEWGQKLELACIESSCEILIFDNITTSSVYQDIRNSLQVISIFQRIAQEINIPVFIIFHTDSKFKENSGFEVSANDVRGNKDAVNKMEYLYGMQRHIFKNDVGSKWVVMTAKILKCRMHNTSGDVYMLNWNVDKKQYVDDTRLDYQEYKKYLRKGAGKKE